MLLIMDFFPFGAAKLQVAKKLKKVCIDCQDVANKYITF